MIGSQRLDFEKFKPISAQVEACLNSHPLTTINSHSIDGMTTLTPDHFLIERELFAYPETVIDSEPSLHKCWTLCQAIVHHFWRRLSQEYLQQLQRLQKWRKPALNLKPGDIVIIGPWPKVIETFPGKDGLVRVVTLRTATATLKLPIAKLAILLRDNQLSQPTESTQPPLTN